MVVVPCHNAQRSMRAHRSSNPILGTVPGALVVAWSSQNHIRVLAINLSAYLQRTARNS